MDQPEDGWEEGHTSTMAAAAIESAVVESLIVRIPLHALISAVAMEVPLHSLGHVAVLEVPRHGALKVLLK